MPFQMALDEILFHALIEKKLTGPLLRFYYASEPWITVGYSHPIAEAAKEVNPPMCRRITGGGRVVHGKDLIFSLIGRKEDDESFNSVRVSYWKIHEAVKQAYEIQGESPRFYRCDAGRQAAVGRSNPAPDRQSGEKLPRGGNCFAFPIATDLAVGNEKVAGGAQKRSSGVFLHQESLKLPGALQAEALKQSLQNAFEKTFNISLQNQNAEPQQLAAAKALAREKYQRDWAAESEIQDQEQALVNA